MKPPFSKCKLCRWYKPFWSFTWKDKSGQKGQSRRCRRCRRQSQWQRHPTLPEPRFRIRHHAIERYIERVAPDLTRTQARDEMIRKMEKAPLVKTAPAWTGAKPSSSRYLLIDEATVFCVNKYRTRHRGLFYDKVATVLVKDYSASSCPVTNGSSSSSS